MKKSLNRREFFSVAAKGLAAIVIGKNYGCGSSSSSQKSTQLQGGIQLDYIDKRLDDFIISYQTSRIIIGSNISRSNSINPISQVRQGAFKIKIDLEAEVKRRYGSNASFSQDVIQEARNVQDPFSTNFIAIGSEADNAIISLLRNSGAIPFTDKIPPPTFGVVEGYNVGGVVITGSNEYDIFSGCLAISEFNRYNLHAKKIHFRGNGNGPMSEFIIY